VFSVKHDIRLTKRLKKRKIIEYGTLRLPPDEFFFLIFIFGIFTKICLHFRILFKYQTKITDTSYEYLLKFIIYSISRPLLFIVEKV